MEQLYYQIKVAGLTRNLQVCKINDDLSIAYFVLFGDVEMTVKAAEQLIKMAPEHDILITAEAKGIPLIHEMARQSNQNFYIIVRKNKKIHMTDALSVDLKPITTHEMLNLFIDSTEASLMRGKRVLIVDDVISTGESLRAVEELVQKAGGQVVGKMAVLAEGDAKNRDDIIFLEALPLLNNDGTPKQ
ncbi:MAG: adenine phosphoribosyltransferase [Lachnospiraceae bacterium]|nr:adenine phosphoribosyltransferase [Lachnospiraceae bacterium]